MDIRETIKKAKRLKEEISNQEIFPKQVIEYKANKDEAIKELNQELVPINSLAHDTDSAGTSVIPFSSNHQHSLDEKHPLTYPVLPEAIAKVDIIRDRALALGWTEDGLYQTHGRFKFPCGQDYGLVCFLEKDEIIGAVTKKHIEIIRISGVRQRFYNKDVDQPWLKKVH